MEHVSGPEDYDNGAPQEAIEDDPLKSEFQQQAAKQGLKQQDSPTSVKDWSADLDLDDLIGVDAAAIAYRDRAIRGDVGSCRVGWPTFDEAMDEMIAPGEMVAFAARTSVGKTWILQHFTEFNLMADPEHYVLFITLEMTGAQVFKRFAAHAYEIKPKQVTNVVISPEWDPTTFTDQYPHLKRMVIWSRGASVQHVEPLIDMAEKKLGHKITMVVLDYLGLLRWSGSGAASPYEQMTRNAQEIQDIAKKRDVVFAMAVQLNRDGGKDGTKEANMSNLRDSGAIEEACDRIFGFYRHEETDKDGFITDSLIKGGIWKNRNGSGAGTKIELRYDEAMRLIDYSPKYSTTRRQSMNTPIKRSKSNPIPQMVMPGGVTNLVDNYYAPDIPDPVEREPEVQSDPMDDIPF